MRKVITFISLLTFFGCGFHRLPTLPEQKNLAEVTIDQSSPERLEGKKVNAILSYQNKNMRQSLKGKDLIGINAEDPGVPVYSLVSVLTEKKGLFYTDFAHRPKSPQVLRSRKILLGDFKILTQCGSLNSDFSFKPVRDVICPLDKGYQIILNRDGQSNLQVLKPLYQSNLYEPYKARGAPRPVGKTGNGFGKSYSDDSLNGSSGSTGKPGTNGKDGKHGFALGMNGGNGGRGGDGESASGTGNYGYDGGNGGKGGNGFKGANGFKGFPGLRGENGPDLEVNVRPIFSKFYHEETLLFMEVNAVWTNNQGHQYRKKTLNYIFHQEQDFVVRSIGGRGGQGGQGGPGGNGGNGGKGGQGGNGGNGSSGSSNPNGTGGSGGKGGNGGNGGKGGNGAIGGRGAMGGKGGLGGDGGNIKVNFYGPWQFVQNAKRHIVFRSVPGLGGKGGLPGKNGKPGDSGSGGSSGSKGSGGSGGSGKTKGSSGSNGSSGYSGVSGSRGGWNSFVAKTGLLGENGRSGIITFNK